MRCPTLQRLLVNERNAWFGLMRPKAGNMVEGRGWDKWSEAIAKLLHRDDLEDYLLEEEDELY